MAGAGMNGSMAEMAAHSAAAALAGGGGSTAAVEDAARMALNMSGDPECPEPERAICRLAARELACELVERRKREREQEA